MTMFFRSLPITLCMLWSLGMNAQTPQQLRDSLSALNREIARSTSYNLDLHLRKASLNVQLQQWEYAIDEYSDILSKEEGNITALFFRAFAYNNLRRYSDAVADYRQVLSRVPRNLEARIGLTETYIRQGKKTEAWDELNTMASLFPDSAMVYVMRASYEHREGMYDLSLYDWDKALEIEPDNGDYLLSKAVTLISAGRKRDALAILRRLESMGVPQQILHEWIEKCK